MENEIIELFEELTTTHKPYMSEGLSNKLEAIKNSLDIIGVTYEYDLKMGLIVNKQKNPTKVVVSHMDLIPLFENGFKEERCFKLTDQCIVGALDNTITNAVLLKVIEQLSKEDNLNNIEFLFSEAEEIGFYGVDNYLKEHRDRFKGTFFINLDVTNEGYKQDASIEYDACNFENLKKIQNIKNQDFFYTMDRVGDDMCSILRNGFHGLSYCLPTKGNIHSYKNKARLDSIEPYYRGLLEIINLDINSHDKNVDFYQFKKALKVDKISKLSKRPKFEEYISNVSEEADFNNSFTGVSNREKHNSTNEENVKKTDKFCQAVLRTMSISPVKGISELYSSDYFLTIFYELILDSYTNEFLLKNDFLYAVNGNEDLLDELFDFLVENNFVVFSRLDKNIFYFA